MALLTLGSRRDTAGFTCTLAFAGELAVSVMLFCCWLRFIKLCCCKLVAIAKAGLGVAATAPVELAPTVAADMTNEGVIIADGCCCAKPPPRMIAAMIDAGSDGIGASALGAVAFAPGAADEVTGGD